MRLIWPALRLVHEGWATLVEINTTLSIIDVFEANEALDAIAAAQPDQKPR